MNDSPPSFDLKRWLDGLSLGQYASALEAQDITLETLCKLTSDDLKECGVQSIGHRKTLMSGIEDLKAQRPSGSPESVPAAPAASNIPEALRNIPAPAFLAEPASPPDAPRESVPGLAGSALSNGGACAPPAAPEQVGSLAGRLTPRARPSSEAAPLVAHAPIAPHEPKQEKPTLFKRFLASYRKANGSSLLLSVGIHAVILLIGTYLVVSRIVEDRKISFGGGEPGSKSEVQHKVKRKATTAPAPNKRITTTSSIAKVALPEMPSVQMNMGPTIANAMGSGGFGSVGAISSGSGGGGGGKGGFSKITFFGLNTGGKGGGFVGTFYDLKQTPSGAPTDMTPAEWSKVVAGFTATWNPQHLSKYFKGPQQLALTQLYIPNMQAAEGPKAFSLEKEVQPKMWLVHYKGEVIAPKTGSFRFVGHGDDALIVRFNGHVVLDWGQKDAGALSKWKSKNDAYVYPRGYKSGLMPGDWVNVTQGTAYPMEILIGERPGGALHFYLLVEEQGVNYRQSKGEMLLPLFRVAEGPLPKEAEIPFAQSAPVWKVKATSASGSLLGR